MSEINERILDKENYVSYELIQENDIFYSGLSRKVGFVV